MGNLLILGAGGHGRVVAEADELENRWNEIAFLDDRNDVAKVLNHNIIGKINEYEKFLGQYDYAVVAIGDNEKRLNLIQKLSKAGYKIPVIIHPRAWVSNYSTIGEGSVILAGAVVNTNANIGKGCIININSSIDHDSTIEDGVHVCSGAVVRSMCHIGEMSYLGAGSCMKPQSTLKAKTVVEDRRI